MNLVIDIGNTNIVMGTFAEGGIHSRWRLNTQKNVTIDELMLTLKGLLLNDKGEILEFKKVALASVVPSLNYQWNAALERVTGIKPEIVSPEKCGDLKLDYKDPDEIGADRLCNVLGLQSLGIKEGIIIDFGTATTFDIYSNNTYWGGAICLGIRTSLDELIRKASKLSEVELYWNSNLIGKNTDDALRNGILFGAIGQIEYIIRKILDELPMENPRIIATGGLAKLVSSHSEIIHQVEENLTLLGLNHFIKIQSGS